jgi:hypothetical protein
VLSSVRPVARAFDLAETTTKVGAPLLRFLAGSQAFKLDTTNKVGVPSLRFLQGRVPDSRHHEEMRGQAGRTPFFCIDW